MRRPVGIFSPARFLLSQSAKPVMAERALRYWKGDGSCCRLANDPLWRALPFSAAPTAYAAAVSRDDLSRLIEEYSGRRPSGVHIRECWSEGWCSAMAGVTESRGLWIAFEPDAPIRVL